MIESIAKLAFIYIITRTFIELVFPAGRHLLKYIYWSSIALMIMITIGPIAARFFNDVHAVAVTYSQGKEAIDKGLPGVFSFFKDSWTMPMAGEVTQQFEGNEHHGIDIAAPLGTSVVAAGEGNVTRVEWSNIYGNMVVINHRGGIEALYGHLQGIDIKIGYPVIAGTKIGSCGSTGRSTGPHLHFEIRVNSKPVNPAEYLK